jgi:death-on-curing family protein
MILGKLRESIFLLELKHFKIIARKEKEILIPSKHHLNQIGSAISSVNYKADNLKLDLETIAAEYFVRICCGHKLPDGNKRLSVVALAYFLEINGMVCGLTNNALTNFAILMAHEKTTDVPLEIKVEFMMDELKSSCKKK